MGRRSEYQSTGGDALRLRVEAGMVLCGWQVKPYDSLDTRLPLSAGFRDKRLIYKAP